MKVARKSPKHSANFSRRATLTLDQETYRKIDDLRGEAPRSAWVRDLINREEERQERARFAALLQKQFTPEVCLQTLAINDEFPIHED